MNLGLKLQHNVTSCQRLVPADLKPNHLAKWILPLHKRGYPFWVPTFYSSVHRCPPPPPRSHLPCFPIKREETWDPAAILMRSCFAWLVITEWFSPLLVEDVFCFFEHKWVFHTDMNASFDWAGEGVRAGHRVGSAFSLLISVSVLLMYNYPSKFAGQIHLWDKRGERGDERWMG